MEMEKIIEKIAQYRNKKGYTYENMADELELTPAAYRKIENFYQENKEITDQLIKAKDQLIEQLQKEIQTLKTR